MKLAVVAHLVRRHLAAREFVHEQPSRHKRKAETAQDDLTDVLGVVYSITAAWLKRYALIVGLEALSRG